MQTSTSQPEGVLAASPGILLHGLARVIAWIVVAALALACLIGFVIRLQAGQEAASLAWIGLLHSPFVPFLNGLELLRAGVYTAVALVIIWRRPHDAIALCTALVLVAAGTFIPSATEALALVAGGPLPSDFTIAVSGIVCLYLLFPDGRLVPSWSWLLPIIWFGWGLLALIVPGAPFDPATWPSQLQFLRVMAWLGCGLAAQWYRYQHVASPAQRQQTRWVLYGAAVTYGTAIGFVLVPLFFPLLQSAGAGLEWYLQIGGTLRTLLMLALPISMAVAVLQYRLWGVDPLLSRTLIYAGLTLSVAAIYVLVVGALSLLFRTTANPLIALIATGVIAIVVQPLREQLQRSVHRLIYGRREEPYTALTRLGQRLEDTLAPETILPTLVETIAQVLHVPYVAIALRQDDTLVPAATYPPQVASAPIQPHRLPLIHQGELIGELHVGMTAPNEPLSKGDQRLLADLTRQAGATVHTLRLTQELQRTLADLQQSRERLVSAREEERRRLRRDLHDGVGPTLASMIQRIDRVRHLIDHDPVQADRALTDLKLLVKTTITDIRGLVYALRPPALDEFGLVGALQQYARAYSASELLVTVAAPPEPLILPAAVEVAAYRIALEALTNVARHAQAHTCQVLLQIVSEHGQDWLMLEVCDDGIGIATNRIVGVGLTAMGERVAELGGTLRIEPAPPHGTCVAARLPLEVTKP